MGGEGRASSVLLSTDWHLENVKGQEGSELEKKGQREFSRLEEIPAKIVDSNGDIKILLLLAKYCP